MRKLTSAGCRVKNYQLLNYKTIDGIIQLFEKCSQQQHDDNRTYQGAALTLFHQK